jgi:dihydrofolate synthase/folylpolyglutamate synthase
LYRAGIDFRIQLEKKEASTWMWQHQDISYRRLPMPHLPLQNAATALMAVQCLQDRLIVSQQAIVRGLAQARLLGRFQCFRNKVGTEIVLDVAHNPAAVSYLAARLQNLSPVRVTRAVVSILSDKNIEETLRPMLEIVHLWYVASIDEARGTTAAHMANCLQKLGVAAYDIRRHSSVVAAYKEACREADAQDRILVFGSFHTVAPVLQSESENYNFFNI